MDVIDLHILQRYVVSNPPPSLHELAVQVARSRPVVRTRVRAMAEAGYLKPPPHQTARGYTITQQGIDLLRGQGYMPEQSNS